MLWTIVERILLRLTDDFVRPAEFEARADDEIGAVGRHGRADRGRSARAERRGRGTEGAEGQHRPPGQPRTDGESGPLRLRHYGATYSIATQSLLSALTHRIRPVARQPIRSVLRLAVGC